MTSCNYNYNECEAKSNKWSNIAFYYLLDIIRINCQTLWSLNHQKNPRKTDSRTFGLDLARALFIPAIRNRSLHGLSTRTLTNCYLETEDRKFLRSTADTSRDPNTPLLPSVSPGLPSRCVQTSVCKGRIRTWLQDEGQRFVKGQKSMPKLWP